MLYSLVVYFLSPKGEMTVIATLDNITSLAYAQELEELYCGNSVSAYIDGYCAGEWI